MGGETFTRGQRVNVEIDGKQVESIFVRAAAPQQAAAGEGAGVARPGSAAEIAWVRRSDTGEVEPVEYRLISAA
jgi:hypothetical protein